MAKRMWQVEAGVDHPDYEGMPPSIHQYESGKDASKVARRYVQKRMAAEGKDVPVERLKVGKNARSYLPADEDSASYAVVSPSKVRRAGFAFRK